MSHKAATNHRIEIGRNTLGDMLSKAGYERPAQSAVFSLDRAGSIIIEWSTATTVPLAELANTERKRK